MATDNEIQRRRPDGRSGAKSAKQPGTKRPHAKTARHEQGDAIARPGLKARQVAAKLLSAVVDQATSLDGLTDPDHGHPHFRQLEPRDRALVKAILTTALRFRGTLEAEIAARLDRPLPANAASLRHILHVGATQIRFLDVPNSAAVDLAVASAEADPRARRFKGLVNAVLRRMAREPAAVLPLDIDCPAWLMERLSAQYGPEKAAAIAEAHRHPAPVDLTVKSDPKGWADTLGGRVIGASTVRLDTLDGPVTELAGFNDGAWWVQDAAAALPVQLFGDLTGRTAADLCAAPGGKTAQLCQAGATVTACELAASRMKRLKANLDRLGLVAETHEGPFENLGSDRSFDAVLLDAPCSSTGTIRRHPDVAYTKSPDEVKRLAEVQAGMLSRAARLVALNGRLVFSNCSIDRDEGEAVIAAFLTAHSDFARDPIAPAEMPDFAEAITADGDLRTTPDMLGGIDGFFAARMKRVSGS